MNLKTTRTAKSSCPQCGAILGAATSNRGKSPSPGDATVCVNCTSVLILTDDLSVRKPTDMELATIEADPMLSRQLKCVQAAVRMINTNPSNN